MPTSAASHPTSPAAGATTRAPRPTRSSPTWSGAPNQLNGPAPASAGDPSWITRNFALAGQRRAHGGLQRRHPRSGERPARQLHLLLRRPRLGHRRPGLGLRRERELHRRLGPGGHPRLPPARDLHVLLRVTDSEGASNVTSRTVTIGDRAPTASIAAATNAIVRRPVAFDASRSRDLDGTITRYQWDLDGNGSFETSTRTPRARHTYRRAARVRPRLRVTDNAGNTATATDLPPDPVRARRRARGPQPAAERARARARRCASAARWAGGPASRSPWPVAPPSGWASSRRARGAS